MSELARKMTEYEIECEKKISEMQSYIDCLKAELAEVQLNKQDSPTEPIKVADMLIDEFTSISGEYARTAIENEYPVNDTAFYSMRQQEVKILRQIAEHLLVYCNNAEEE